MRKLPLNKVLIGATCIFALFVLTRVEIDDFKLKTIIYPISWVAIGIFGFKYYNILRGSASAIRKSLFGLALGFYILGTLYFGLRIFMCAEDDHGVSFTHKKDRSLSLVCRTYDCYGTADHCQLYKVRTLTKHIKWVIRFNEIPVDTNIWQH